MKVSASTIYGLKILLELSLNPHKPITVDEIAENQNLPKSFISQILPLLKANGYVNSFKGSNGGHILALDPIDIKLSHVVSQLENGLLVVSSKETETNNLTGLLIDEVYNKLENEIYNYLNDITLKDLKTAHLDKISTFIYSI